LRLLLSCFFVVDCIANIILFIIILHIALKSFMYFDERMKISDEKEKPLGKGAFVMLNVTQGN